MLPYTAYLRVYQPLPAFPPYERVHWRSYADAPARPRRAEAVTAEHEDSLLRMTAAPAALAPGSESAQAYVRKFASQTFICPWQTRLRSWIALRELHEQLSPQLAATWLPRTVAEEARNQLEQWRATGHSTHTQIRLCNWEVPLAWLLPFDATERCLLLGSGKDPVPLAAESDAVLAPPRTLLYVTEMTSARQRVQRAVSALRGADIPDSGLLLTRTEEVQEWLHHWHPGSLVELDYAGLVRLLTDEQLTEDHSVAEMSATVAGMERGERGVAMAMHRRLRRRWSAVRALERAS